MIAPPRAKIEYRQVARWLIYPIVFVVYTLIRGPFAEWYPYPFLDPDAAGGYALVALYCVGIAAGMALFAWLVALLGRFWAQPAVAP